MDKFIRNQTIVAVLSLVLILGCTKKNKSNTLSDSELQTDKPMRMNILSLYKRLPNVELSKNNTFKFPLIKEEDNIWNVIDEEMEEVISEATVDTVQNSIEFSYGYFYIRTISEKTPNGNIILCDIQESEGAYTDSHLFVFKEYEGIITDSTNENIDFKELERQLMLDSNLLRGIIMAKKLSFNEPIITNINQAKVDVLCKQGNEKLCDLSNTLSDSDLKLIFTKDKFVLTTK